MPNAKKKAVMAKNLVKAAGGANKARGAKFTPRKAAAKKAVARKRSY